MLEDRIINLVHQKVVFDHLMDMGMIGSTGRKAMAESCRRNANIKALQKSLNVDNKTLNKLVQQAKDEGWFK